ncbi:MAG TPA: hypothetical protein DD827_08290, partial [Gammaproteobacteria bacterium]|nr:hypothetical protein [Gammaproteobacteria bacterium]
YYFQQLLVAAFDVENYTVDYLKYCVPVQTELTDGRDTARINHLIVELLEPLIRKSEFSL